MGSLAGTVLLLVAMAPVNSSQLGRFTGDWTNADSSRRGIVRVLVSAGKELTVQAWASCSPTPCDWGAASAVPYFASVSHDPSSAPQALIAVSKAPFQQTIIVLKPEGDGGLGGEFYSRFTDRSGRDPYVFVEHFVRRPSEKTP